MFSLIFNFKGLVFHCNLMVQFSLLKILPTYNKVKCDIQYYRKVSLLHHN